ncbi:peroxide stress protein YaaA [Neisseriaceae bacterium ESL0693]|nr:peroxide stress protein YaaA [Neisseriaceae bacterium ESL0693]
MYFVLSPAKKLNEQDKAPISQYTQPGLLEHSQQLMPILKSLAPQDIASLIGISDKLALLNAERFQQWHTPFTPENAKQAIYLFNGDVYDGINAYQLSTAAMDYLQNHAGILSGLYGLLRPLDLIQPYRLEMGTKLANNRGADLYAFWQPYLTPMINQHLASQQDNVLINLASQEYFKAIQPAKLNARIITPVFKDQKNGQYKIISFYAKRARGLMMRYAAENQLTQPEQLKQFDSEGYYFDKASSTEQQWVFLRDENYHN